MFVGVEVVSDDDVFVRYVFVIFFESGDVVM